MSESTRQADPVEHRTIPEPNDIRSMHDILSCWERRALLYYLQERENPASLSRLAAHLAGWRRGEDAPADHTQAFRRALCHEHLRRMETFGVVSYDVRADTVTLADDMTVAVCAPWRRPEATDDDSRDCTAD